MATKLIAGGAWVQVLVDTGSGLQAIGMASGCSYDEDWAIQQANVLNHLGPISLDSQGYTCSINVTAFVPEATQALYEDGGEITIEDIIPYRDDVQTDGKGRSFAQMAFLNTATGKVLRSFSDVVVASNGEQVAPNAYVTSSLRFLARKRDKVPAAA
jgi:hypothetical protein